MRKPSPLCLEVAELRLQAAFHGNCSVLAALLAAKANPNSTGALKPFSAALGKLGRPSAASARCCYSEVSQRERGCLVGLCSTPAPARAVVLQWAVLLGFGEGTLPRSPFAAAGRCADHRGWCPLHIAAQEGHREAARALVHQGASHQAATANGNTALHVASWLAVSPCRGEVNAGAPLPHTCEAYGLE